MLGATEEMGVGMGMDETQMIPALQALRGLLDNATATMLTNSSLRIGRWARRLSKISQ